MKFPLLLRLRNAVDYPLRQLIRWRRGGFIPQAGSKDQLFSRLAPADRARAEQIGLRLSKQYHLEPFAQSASPENYRENLFYLAMLEAALEQGGLELPGTLRVADIGPSSWFYVQAQHAFLRWWRCPDGRLLQLDGYEADAYRVYADLRSRYDHALGHIRSLEGVTFHPQPFSARPGQFDLVFMLFPFVFEQDHLTWGLPGGMFRPDALLQSAWDSLCPGGGLVIVNQGEAEHRVQLARLEAIGIRPAVSFRQEALLYSYPNERWVLVARREVDRAL